MLRPEPVLAICQPSNFGIGGNDRIEFIRCVDGKNLEIHEYWTFREDIITPEIHPFARVDIGAFVGDCFATDYLNENGRRVPMFGEKND